VGAVLNFGSSGHTTRFTAKCLVEDLQLILEILTDCLYNPTFPPEHVEKRRGEILTVLQQREHNTQAMASLRFNETMYPNHPYGRSQLGYRDTVENLTHRDVETFYREHYGARGMVVILVGAVTKESGLDMLESTMGVWRGANLDRSPLPAINPLTEIYKIHIPIPGKTQSDIALGWIGLKRRDPDFFSAYLADCILGQFGMMGRIGEQIRDGKGLAYYAYTSLDAGLGPGPWAVIAGVAPDNIDRATEAILQEIRRLRHEPVDEQELSDNKAFIIGSMPLRLEGKEGIAAQIASIEMYQLGLDYLKRFPGMIQVITPQDVMTAAQKYMNPDAYILSVAGPPQREEE
jgi:zinc protease